MNSNIIKHKYSGQPDLFINQYDLANRKYEAHVHEGYELGTIIKGTGKFRYGECEYKLQPGDAYFLNCKTPHAHFPTDNSILKYIFVHIKPDSVESLAPRDKFPQIISPFLALNHMEIQPLIHNAEKIQALLKQTIDCYYSNDPFRYFKSWSLIIESLIEFNRELSTNNMIKINPLINERIKTFKVIKDYLKKNYKDDISLPQISHKFNLSCSKVMKLFNENINSTPIKYLNHFRIDKSIVLLKTTSFTVEKIAYECGFKDISNFRRLFKNITGKCPSNIREESKV